MGIAGAMDSEAVEPPGAAARRAVGNTQLRAAELASVLRRVADTLEQSAWRSLMRMPRGMSRLGEGMMLRWSVKRAAALVRLRGRRVRVPMSASNSPRSESRKLLTPGPRLGAQHVTLGDGAVSGR
jgi:hypothetical protein